VTVADETRTFAESVAAAVDRTLGEPAPWRPGSTVDDRRPELTAALAAAGWPALREEPELLPFAGPGGRQLGRRLAPLCELDVLLGGSPLAGDLVRYCGEGARAVRVDHDGLTLIRVNRSLPCPYGDAIGVARVVSAADEQRIEGRAASVRLAAWIAAAVGYCAGAGEFALELTLDYARNRRAFGTTLAGLQPVQQMLADAATAVRGLRLLASGLPDAAALAHAGPALCAATSVCQQVSGAVAFMLEYPLQRVHRRAGALRLWNDAVLAELVAIAPGG
jgi:alkylation response protein AidB-like acyl-CoA dehydrogenase